MGEPLGRGVERAQLEAVGLEERGCSVVSRDQGLGVDHSRSRIEPSPRVVPSSSASLWTLVTELRDP